MSNEKETEKEGSGNSSFLKDLPFFLALVALPLSSWYLATMAQHYSGRILIPQSRAELDVLLSHVAVPSLAGILLFLGWLVFQALLSLYAPGRTVLGEPLEDGTRLAYRVNGFAAMCISLLLAGMAVLLGWVPGDFLYRHLADYITAANIVAIVVCLFVHRLARRHASPAERRLRPIEAFFTGATLNPRLGRFDFKFYFESRPGFILWLLILASCAFAQYQQHGTVTNAMILICIFQALNVVDYFLFEEAILTTWDIRHERFGFMLCWGTVLWVPLTYTLQAVYLVANPVTLPTWAVVAITTLNMTGYLIFRQSNLQKFRFRKNPQTLIRGKPARYIRTQQGNLLLTSGWWGLSRHANYMGDLMMGLSWCLVCGFEQPIPWFYGVYLLILLTTRERRDAAHCALRYGADWARYEREVKWRIVPGVY